MGDWGQGRWGTEGKGDWEGGGDDEAKKESAEADSWKFIGDNLW